VNLKAATAVRLTRSSRSATLSPVSATPHLQVIMAIITITFIVDVMVDYQFSAMAKASFSNKEDLTAFLGASTARI
jgi:hypothetical protein